MKLKSLFLFSLFLILFPTLTFAQTTNDITSKVENLGNPTKVRWSDTSGNRIYSRNVWDLKAFGGKIYLGSGDGTLNTGPIDVITYRPDTSSFVTEYTVNEETIIRYRVINNQLVIPGADAKESQALGNWYRLENTGWVKYRNIPEGVHVFDIETFGGKLFAGLGSGVTSTVQVSSDDGKTWQSTNTSLIDRTYTFFTLGGKLYAVKVWNPTSPTYAGMSEYAGGTTFNPVTSFTFNQIFPNTSSAGIESATIAYQVNFLNSLVYIAADTNFTLPHVPPLGIYKISQNGPTTGANLSSTTKITLPGNSVPKDLLVGANEQSSSSSKLYALGSIQNGTRYWVTVSSTTDLINWIEEFRFDAPTFARSFEQFNGDFYFGLGTDMNILSTAAGDILRYKVASTPSPSPTVSRKPGDTDGDNDVDIFDYNQILTEFGKRNDQNTKSDLDNDDDVDIFDYNLLLTNFGK